MPTNTYRDRVIMMLATGFKFLRDTPDSVRSKIIDHVLYNDENKELPVSLQPFKENIKMLKQHEKATMMVASCNATNDEIDLVDKEFDDITEDDFIDLYKDWRNRRVARRESTDSSDTKWR